MKLEVIRQENQEFNLFQTKISGNNITTIRGDRLLSHYGNMHVLGMTEFELPSPSFSPAASSYANGAKSNVSLSLSQCM